MAVEPKAPLLHISQLTKRFGAVTALWKVDLDVFPGDSLAIFGPNGAGKTTLLRLLAQLAGPSEGKVEFPGRQSGRERVGYVSHHSLLYNELTGLENLTLFAKLYSLDEPEQKAEALLQKMNLWRARHQLAHGYSSGMKQRLTIARALLHEPEILLLDEPYAGLDQHGSRLLTGLLNGLKSEGRTILLITHNLWEGLALSSRVVVMNRGQIVFQAPRCELEDKGFESLYFGLIDE